MYTTNLRQKQAQKDLTGLTREGVRAATLWLVASG